MHMHMYILAFTFQDEATAERLKKLSLFQLTILKHALTFPAVKKVVYSTCSVHKEVRTIYIYRLAWHSSFLKSQHTHVRMYV